MTPQMKQESVVVLAVSVFFFSLGMPLFSKAGESASVAGDAVQIAIPTFAYGLTFGQDDPEGRIQFYKGFFSTVGITHGLKRAVNSTRPNGSRFAFPAGHVSAAFGGAAFLAERYGWTYGLPATLGAMYVGWSRIDSDEHYLEDVLAGAAIGIAASAYFTEPRDGLAVQFEIGGGEYYVLIQKRW